MNGSLKFYSEVPYSPEGRWDWFWGLWLNRLIIRDTRWSHFDFHQVFIPYRNQIGELCLNLPRQFRIDFRCCIKLRHETYVIISSFLGYEVSIFKGRGWRSSMFYFYILSKLSFGSNHTMIVKCFFIEGVLELCVYFLICLFDFAIANDVVKTHNIATNLICKVYWCCWLTTKLTESMFVWPWIDNLKYFITLVMTCDKPDDFSHDLRNYLMHTTNQGVLWSLI